MVTNFEHHTKDVNSTDLKHIDNLIELLKTVVKQNPIKSDDILKYLNDIAINQRFTKIDGPRLRKLINYIRSNSILPIIATQHGYFVSYDVLDISNEIKGLTERSNSILDCCYGLNKILKNGL